MNQETGIVKAVSKSPTHSFSKKNETSINLLKGLGIEGDAHCGATVKHKSRVAKTPELPNLRQVHLIHAELLAELSEKGFAVKAGELGENITTEGIDLLGLPKDTILKIGDTQIGITGLRSPCSQIDRFQSGLMKAVLDKDNEGNLIRKSGIMGVVLEGGTIKAGDAIEIVLPKEPFIALEVV